jgi:phytanoyl-CoA hydroxylase
VPALDQARIAHFRANGFLVVEDLLDVARDLRPIEDEYVDLLDRLASRWRGEGMLTSTYADLPFGQRLSHVLAEAPDRYPYLDIALSNPPDDVGAIHLGPAIFALLTNSRILDAVESLIGPEILCNPIQHATMKIPEDLRQIGKTGGVTVATTWHQDQGVCLPEADDTELVTVWIPMVNADERNGCLQVVRGSHHGELVPHCPDPAIGRHIPDRYLDKERIVAVPVQRGGALFMHRRTMHASLPNRSDSARWSFDIRFNPIGQPTGRPGWPSFVARSRRDPSSELRDPGAWVDLWRRTAAELAASGEALTLSRWTGNEPGCN